MYVRACDNNWYDLLLIQASIVPLETGRKNPVSLLCPHVQKQSTTLSC